MPATCCVFKCKTRKNKNPDLKFFRLPVDENRLELWLKRINRGDNLKPSEHTRICQLHFIEGEFLLNISIEIETK